MSPNEGASRPFRLTGRCARMSPYGARILPFPGDVFMPDDPQRGETGSTRPRTK